MVHLFSLKCKNGFRVVSAQNHFGEGPLCPDDSAHFSIGDTSDHLSGTTRSIFLKNQKKSPFTGLPVPIAQMVERPLREREVVGLNPGRAIPKALNMVPMATLHGAQHYKANTGSPVTHYKH